MMKIAFSSSFAVRLGAAFFAAGCLGSAALTASAQQPPSSSVQVQHAAMRKLAFLAGRWSGPVTILRGPGQALHLMQSENVQYKLDGLVLLIEGKSASPDGKAEFSALATVSFDDTTRTYHIRAYNDGRYVDTEFSLLADGFSWGFPSGPVRVTNTMHLTTSGEWQEASEFSMRGAPPHPSVRMMLHRLP